MNGEKFRRAKKNKGASILIIVVLVALIAIPYFYGEKTPTPDGVAIEEGDATGTSWFRVYNPPEITPSTQPTTKTEAEAETPAPTTISVSGSAPDTQKTSPTSPAPSTQPTTETKTGSTPDTTKTVTPIPTPVPAPAAEEVDVNKSNYSGKIAISSVSGGSSDPKKESITIKNISKTDAVSITNFTIETYKKDTFKITKGYELPGIPGVPEQNITLKPGDYINIYVSSQERKMNFRENICTGYFDQFSDFGGRLNHSCPKIDISDRLDFSANCIKVLNAIPSCRMFNTANIVESDCNEFAIAHYSYVGCVNDFKTRSNFYSKRWLMWMQRGSEFFRNDRELVTLKDTEGKIVDEYRY